MRLFDLVRRRADLVHRRVLGAPHHGALASGIARPSGSAIVVAAVAGGALIAAAIVVPGCKNASGAGAGEPDGRALFRSMCGRCHGGDGTGGFPAREGLPAPRNFHDSAFQASRSDEDIMKVIVHGKPPWMPPFGSAFSEAELRALVRQIRSFDPRLRR